jgi:hypothetical protein
VWGVETGGLHTLRRLLAPLSEPQQRIIDLIATTFVEEASEWPVFDYLEGEFDADGIDAAGVLESLPRDASGSYAAAWWPRAPNARPAPDVRVALTVLGIHHSRTLGSAEGNLRDAFFALLELMAERRRTAPRSRTKPSTVEITSDQALAALSARGFHLEDLPPHFLYEFLEHEPATWGASRSITDDSWTRGVPRAVLQFQGVRTMEQYLERTIAFLKPYRPTPRPVAPSPFGLVATIDYLDTVWRLVPSHGDHLFRLHSAQKAAQLAFPVAGADEFDARLSALAEIVRSVQVPRSSPSGKRGHDRGLTALEAYLVRLLPGSQLRIERSIATLQNVLDLRDAGQHSAAGRKGAAAFEALGIGYPPAGWALAWEVVGAKTIEALTALREEIASSVD